MFNYFERKAEYIDKRKRRRGLKWRLLDLFYGKYFFVAASAVAVLLIIIVIISIASCNKTSEPQAAPTQPTTVAATESSTSYKITGVPLISQTGGITAACETYACTMLLQYYGFDINEYDFIDEYLLTKPVSYGSDGLMYGPDMNSAYAGDIYTGYGINAKGMAKYMNKYIKTTSSKKTAIPLDGISLKEICEKYIRNDIPVMVWATTYMDEPYVKAEWIVDYADDDSDVKVGDTVSWQMHEHCMVLVGYDDENYYFNDSVSGEVSAYDIKTSEERYSQLGMQAIYLSD